MTIRPIHTVSEGYAFSPANGIAADVMYEKTDKKYRRGSLLSRRWAALSRKKKAGVLLSAFVLMYILGALYRSTTQDDIVLVTSTDDLPLVTVRCMPRSPQPVALGLNKQLALLAAAPIMVRHQRQALHAFELACATGSGFCICMPTRLAYPNVIS